MSKLVLVPQEVGPMNTLGATPGYGMVRFQRENEGKVREMLVYNPALWDALRATRRSPRQRELIKKVMGKG